MGRIFAEDKPKRITPDWLHPSKIPMTHRGLITDWREPQTDLEKRIAVAQRDRWVQLQDTWLELLQTFRVDPLADAPFRMLEGMRWRPVFEPIEEFDLRTYQSETRQVATFLSTYVRKRQTDREREAKERFEADYGVPAGNNFGTGG